MKYIFGKTTGEGSNPLSFFRVKDMKWKYIFLKIFNMTLDTDLECFI